MALNRAYAIFGPYRSIYQAFPRGPGRADQAEVEYVSFRENIDTGRPLGRAIIIVGTVAELERNLIIERVRAGMRRARLEGQHIGRPPLILDHGAILQDRQRGQSLGQIARTHSISRATVHRVIHSEMPAQSAVS